MIACLRPISRNIRLLSTGRSHDRESYERASDVSTHLEDGQLITYDLCLDNGPDGDGTTMYCESTPAGASSCYSDRHGQLIIPRDSGFEGPTGTLAADPTPTPVVTDNARD